MVFNLVILRWDHNFLHDTNDIYSIHSKPQKKEKSKKVIVKIKNNKSNVIDFNSYRREDVKV